MEYEELDDLKYIKKHYGENMSHLCRELFPSVLERSGLLYHLLTTNFNPSRSLYYDIVNEKKVNNFKDYIYSFIDKEQEEKQIIDKSVKKLLESVGYDIYECKNNDDIQRFRKYYKDNEELCTFRDPDRIDNHYIFFIVKKNVDDIKRKDFDRPKREDEYGVSVLDLQFDKGKNQRVSIKCRYNHTVRNPDATYSNNLDNIVEGLTEAFEREYGFNIGKEYKSNFHLNSYVKASNGKFYKFNNEIDNIHYCKDNIIIDDGNIIEDYKDKGRYTLFDYFILDEKEKKIFIYDSNLEKKDCFARTHDNITNITIIKKDGYREIELTLNNKENAIIKIDNDNRLIGYINKHIKIIGDGFLLRNKSVRELKLPNITKIGGWFMVDNRELLELSMPKLKSCKMSFLLMNKKIRKINLPELSIVGDCFLEQNYSLKEIDLPKLSKCGSEFMLFDDVLEKVNLPSLEMCGNSFFAESHSLKELSLPKLKKCGSYFLIYNTKLNQLSLPNLESCGSNFLANNHTLTSIDLPSLINCGSYFLNMIVKLERINLPLLEICENDFLINESYLKELSLPKLRICGDFFFSQNSSISKINLPSLEECGYGFFGHNNNSSLKELYLPSLVKCGQFFFEDNNTITSLNLPKLKKCGLSLLKNNKVLERINMPLYPSFEKKYLKSNKTNNRGAILTKRKE